MSPTTNSLVVSLLADRPSEELQSAIEKAEGEVRRLRVEIEQMAEALARQSRRGARKSSPPRTSSPAMRGRRDTRKRVLDLISDADRPITPAEVIARLEADGSAPSGGAVYNLLKRLTNAGEIERISTGQYRLAGRSNVPEEDAAHGLERNGVGTLSFAASPHEGS